MTTINNIRAEFAQAKAEQNTLMRARKMLSIQRMAAQSRSRHAYKIECDAHLAAVCALDHAADADQHTRSELGRIRAESQHRFSAGNTPSRSVVPVL